MFTSKITNLNNRFFVLGLILILTTAMVLTVGCGCKTKIKKSQPVGGTITQPENPAPPAPAPVAPAVDANQPNVTENKTDNETKTVTTTPDAKAEEALQMVHFAFDKYNLTSEATDILKKNTQWLKDHANANVRVEGNCDERGTVEYNLALGEKRAKAVKEYYISLGIAAERIQTISYGKEKPLETAQNEEAYAMNRRSETKETK